jgi:hypothetical protein
MLREEFISEARRIWQRTDPTAASEATAAASAAASVAAVAPTPFPAAAAVTPMGDHDPSMTFRPSARPVHANTLHHYRAATFPVLDPGVEDAPGVVPMAKAIRAETPSSSTASSTTSSVSEPDTCILA